MFVEDDKVSLMFVRTPVWSVKAFRRPPVDPIGAWNIEISKQLWEN